MNAKETGLLAPPRSEGERGEPEQSGEATSSRAPTPAAEATSEPPSRRFTAAYKRRIVRETENCASGGSLGTEREQGGVSVRACSESGGSESRLLTVLA